MGCSGCEVSMTNIYESARNATARTEQADVARETVAAKRDRLLSEASNSFDNAKSVFENELRSQGVEFWETGGYISGIDVKSIKLRVLRFAQKRLLLTNQVRRYLRCDKLIFPLTKKLFVGGKECYLCPDPMDVPLDESYFCPVAVFYNNQVSLISFRPSTPARKIVDVVENMHNGLIHKDFGYKLHDTGSYAKFDGD